MLGLVFFHKSNRNLDKRDLRYNRNQWEPVGKDPDAAIAAKRRREIALEGITGVSVTAGDSRRTIDGAIAQYLTDTGVQKKPRTLAAYRIALTQFRESCPKTYLEELERRDLLNFVRSFASPGR